MLWRVLRFAPHRLQLASIGSSPRHSCSSHFATHPNPARKLSQLEYKLHRSGLANLAVYDLRGRRVRVLRDGWHPAGSHSVAWDGRDDAGQASAAGVYVYRLESDGSVRTQRMILRK